MVQLAIKGHPTRGGEVIQLLEMLGGNNNYSRYRGYNSIVNTIYYIDSSDKNFIKTEIPSNISDFSIFTLEDFEKKFPYKVGDKVTLDKSPCIITEMYWDCDDVIYYVDGDDFSKGVYSTDKDLQPYKEETMEESIDKTNKVIFETNAQCCDIRNEIIKKDMKQIKIDIPKGYEFFGIDDDNKIVLTEKQPQYPKTYEECCKVLAYEGGATVIGYDAVLLNSFQKLKLCRDAYWKIAGEQMGLGKPWEPDWNEETDKFTISNKCNKIYFNNTAWYSEVLAFPAPEMRDAFYENFKDLMNDCKELL